jgi:hypothetical protein
VIQDFAQTVSEQIRMFGSTRTTLVSRVALLLLSFEQANLALSRGVLQKATEAMATATTGPLREMSPELERGLANLEQLRGLAKLVASEMARALRVAAAVYILRQTELEIYLQKTPRVDVATARGALASAIGEEGAAQALEVVAVEAVKLVGAAIPIANVAVAVVQIGLRIREKVHAMQAHYERGALDAMFDLAQQVDDERAVIGDVFTLLDGVEAFFRATVAFS